MTQWFDTCQTIQQILERRAVPCEREMLATLRKLGRRYLKFVELHAILEHQRNEIQGAKRMLRTSRIPPPVVNDMLGDLPNFLYGSGRPLYLGVRVDSFLNSPKFFILTFWCSIP